MQAFDQSVTRPGTLAVPPLEEPEPTQAVPG
jgi:hypothetical protein